MNLLVQHIAALRQRFIAEHGKEPKILALGRWDVRELVRAYADLRNDMSLPRPSRLLREMREGTTVWDAQVKVDGRIGRMPGALFWQADRRH